ncbi:hypothetical protein QEG73_14940 [Chitinophagaceae bacterium 26-R-25]|nr:hypothetical protein [Chitinophagaceae bacterium 26-R-25]
MENTKAVILSIAAFISLAIIIMVIQFLSRKLKNKSHEDGKIKLSFGIWFSTFFLSASLIMARTIVVFGEAVDNVYKITPDRGLFESFKKGSLFIGLSILWLLIWYIAVNRLSYLVMGKRKPANEIDIDNYTFFIVRGILLIGFTICLLPAFDIILREFIPSVQIPFYH